MLINLVPSRKQNQMGHINKVMYSFLYFHFVYLFIIYQSACICYALVGASLSLADFSQQ